MSVPSAWSVRASDADDTQLFTDTEILHGLNVTDLAYLHRRQVPPPLFVYIFVTCFLSAFHDRFIFVGIVLCI